MKSSKESIQVFMGPEDSESAWVLDECLDNMKFNVRCLICGYKEPREQRPPRCPNCKAKMINPYW